MREELIKSVDIQQREMIKRLDHIVNEEQQQNVGTSCLMKRY
ncbi:hypothetical protein O9929_16545 [Vibrio lentus]|nr:hypothetical protein [Vibrio lentus]